MTYGNGDWVRNVVHAGGAQLITRGRTHRIVNPTLVERHDHDVVPLAVRLILQLIHADQRLLVDEVAA